MRAEDAEVESKLIDALTIARGHFLYESGHHGDVWLDLNATFVDARRIRTWAQALARRTASCRASVVCGPMVGGALLAQLIAAELGASFVFAEQVAAPDGDTSYRIPQSLRPVLTGKRVLLVDDAVNAGSAWRSMLHDLRECRIECAGFATLLTLGEAAARIAEQHAAPLYTLASLERGLWAPEDCPLCRAGVPLSYDLIRR